MIEMQPVNVGRDRRSKGYAFHLNEFMARAASKEPPRGTVEVEQDTIEVALTKEGVLEMLRKYAKPSEQSLKDNFSPCGLRLGCATAPSSPFQSACNCVIAFLACSDNSSKL